MQITNPSKEKSSFLYKLIFLIIMILLIVGPFVLTILINPWFLSLYIFTTAVIWQGVEED